MNGESENEGKINFASKEKSSNQNLSKVQGTEGISRDSRGLELQKLPPSDPNTEMVEMMRNDNKQKKKKVTFKKDLAQIHHITSYKEYNRVGDENKICGSCCSVI